ncbi:MAG: hypothetical protein N2235_21235 [Fischerella sp.]|nr:hypothetical protein [Fischerella sp.]
MVNKINDIAWQARQGSVAAIIQVLNEKLANSGVRTRAVFDDGVLQLLCEAQTVDKLEQSTLVKQIQQILESIAPRNIRRVNINSRIVREQQLLWLEEITRDPENQLLWSEEIILETPNYFQELIKKIRDQKSESAKLILPKFQSSRPKVITNHKLKNSAWGRLSVALSLCLFLLLLGWLVYAVVNGKLKNLAISGRSNSQAPTIESSIQTEDTFIQAVRIANQASAAGKTAKNSTQWLEIAADWQRASDLMSQVSPSHSRYQEAQIRTKLYQQYSKEAQKEAEKSKF